MANPTSTTDPNRFVSVINTFKEDILNSVPGNLASVYLVPEVYASIQVAIDTAVLDGHDQYDPAVISVTPDSSTGTSVTDVQFTEDITLYDGIYLMSAVPHKRVNISGVLALGSTALGTDLAGTADTTLWYLLRDVHFIADGGGASLLNTSVNVVTRLDMIRVDMTNTGLIAADNCVTIDATAIHTVNLDECTWTTAGSNAANYCLSVDGAAHVVTASNNCSLTVTGALTVNAVVVDDGATFTASDTDITGLINLGATTASFLNLTNGTVTGNVAAATGLVTFAANNASIATAKFTKFIPNTHVNIFTIGGATNIIRGFNCSWEGRVTAITAINSGAVAAVGAAGSSWEGGPVPNTAGAPANSIAQMLYANSAGGNAVIQV